MIVALRLRNSEADRDLIEKWLRGERHALRAEIAAQVKYQFVRPGPQRAARDQRLIGPAILVGGDGEEPGARRCADFEQLDHNTLRGSAVIGIKHVSV